MIPITIGSYPILDRPPSYSAVNTIVAPMDRSINLNTNDTDVNMNLRSALSVILNNEQVVRPQSTVTELYDAKATDAEMDAPYPHYGKLFPKHSSAYRNDTRGVYTRDTILSLCQFKFKNYRSTDI